MKQLLERIKFNFHFETWLAEFVGVFFDRAHVAPALLTAQRIRSLVALNRFFKRF